MVGVLLEDLGRRHRPPVIDGRPDGGLAGEPDVPSGRAATLARMANDPSAPRVEYQDLAAVRRKLRSNVRWARDCGSAAIGSGATVGFALVVSGSPIRRDVFVPLVAAYGVLLLFAVYYWWRFMDLLGKATVLNVLNATGSPRADHLDRAIEPIQREVADRALQRPLVGRR
jgi:hypothetical protein